MLCPISGLESYLIREMFITRYMKTKTRNKIHFILPLGSGKTALFIYKEKTKLIKWITI